MIVMKFGGTSVQDAEAMGQVIAIVKSKLVQRPIVVVSAMAKVTDMLIKCAQLAREGKEVEARRLVDILAQRHHETATTLIRDSLARKSVEETVDSYLEEVRILISGLAILGELSAKSLDAVASYGERLSSLILSVGMQEAGISAELIDARQMIITDDNYAKAVPLLDLSSKRLNELLPEILKKGHVPVTQGFISSTRDGITSTLGRGGSDYSAALIGALLDVDVIEIWTDVDGILTADPKIVPSAQVLETVTFQEASELAYFGAKVLHPSTILPAVERNIPVHVYNTKRPESKGTHIVSTEASEGHHNYVKSIAYKKGITVINVYSTRMLLAHGFLKSIFEVFDKFETSVDIVSTSEVNVSLTIDDTSQLEEIVKELRKFSSVTIEHGKAIICLVGEKMRYTPGIAARIFSAVREVNINMISQGASEINLSFIVNESDIATAVQKLHHEFFKQD
jgi:aspartate kinase